MDVSRRKFYVEYDGTTHTSPKQCFTNEKNGLKQLNYYIKINVLVSKTQFIRSPEKFTLMGSGYFHRLLFN